MAKTMMAIVTTGNGGYDKLEYREVPIPEPGPGEVLVKVLAAGVNNTDINTRLGWYSPSFEGGTNRTQAAQEAAAERKIDGGWNRATPFPLIQGTDCCGEVVAITSDAQGSLMGKRVLIRPCVRSKGFRSMETVWMASDFDGAFAGYVKIAATEVFPVECDWTDVELASIPCAWGSAENMVHRARVSASDPVLITGASGGVGSGAVQLAKRRGARVLAVCGRSKMEAVRSLGADAVFAREADLIAELGKESVSVVIDNVAGPGFSVLLELMQRGGRYASSGAIAGPVVQLDMRIFYLKDLNLIGCTAWDEPVFPNLIRYIERGEIRPVVAKTFPLEDIAKAQQEFLKKEHVGKFVLVPPES